MDPAPSDAKHGATRFTSAVLLALLAALAACHSTSAGDEPAYVREIEAANRHLESEFSSGNLLGVADLYTEDAVIVDAEGRRTAGRVAIDRYWTSIEHPLEWRLEIRRVRGSNWSAFELARSRMTTLQDGQRRTVEWEMLLIWRRQPGGAWRIEAEAHWPLPR